MAFCKADGASEQQRPQQRQQDDLAGARLNGKAPDQLGRKHNEQGQRQHARTAAGVETFGFERHG